MVRISGDNIQYVDMTIECVGLHPLQTPIDQICNLLNPVHVRCSVALTHDLGDITEDYSQPCVTLVCLESAFGERSREILNRLAFV